MAISKEIYNALEAIVGPAYISDDPVICEGYQKRTRRIRERPGI